MTGMLDGVRVLIMDGDTDNREALAAVMKCYGAHAQAIPALGEGPCALCRDQLPQVVIADLFDPEQIQQLVSKIRSCDAGGHGSLPVLALSAWARPGEAERARHAGCAAYLMKPADIDRLLRTVQHLAEAYRASYDIIARNRRLIRESRRLRGQVQSLLETAQQLLDEMKQVMSRFQENGRT